MNTECEVPASNLEMASPVLEPITNVREREDLHAVVKWHEHELQKSASSQKERLLRSKGRHMVAQNVVLEDEGRY